MEDKTMTLKLEGLLQTQELYQYILDTNVYPREPQILKELRAATFDHPRPSMATAPDAGQLIALLLKQANAKKTIEVGVFTGYSLLLTALTIPQDGKVIGIDRDLSAYEIGLPIIEKSGVAHKIDFIESEALPALNKLLENDENVGSFDFAYVDGDKIEYSKYHERLLQLVKPGGMIIYDNTLWGGTVAMSEELVTNPRKRELRSYIIEFNKCLAVDTRVDISLLPLGDGMTICRRL